MFKFVYKVSAVIKVPVMLTVSADTKEQAEERVRDGAWRAAAPDYDRAEVLSHKDALLVGEHRR